MLQSADARRLPNRPLRLAVGAAASLAIAGLIVGLLAAILGAAGAGVASIDMAIVPDLLRMTTLQAGLSTLLSLCVGMALAWALNRLMFSGRGLLVAVFASAIVTPGIIVAFGLLAIWGRAGWINAALAPLGLSIGTPVFGLGGIVAAHVILNGAFAARILLGRLDSIPATRLKTGQSLGLDAWRRFAVLDWPAMRGTLPGLAAVIFLLAFTSFPIVLLLGGGPANQTFEVAIYAAVRLDFDLAGAVVLAGIQIAVCSIVILAASALEPIPAAFATSRLQRWRDGRLPRLLQIVVLVLATTGFILPLLAVLLDGLRSGVASVLGRPAFWGAAGTSIGIGAGSAIMALGLALLVAAGRAATANKFARIAVGAPAYAYLAVPAVVLSLGFFLATRAIGVPVNAAAPLVVIIANALLALPFAVATLGPPLEAVARDKGRLIQSLGLGGRRQFVRVELPLLSREIGVVLALAFCFSLGDLGVIALFGTSEFTTLPLYLYRALGSYRGNDAAVVAAALLLLTITAFAVLPPLTERVLNARR